MTKQDSFKEFIEDQLAGLTPACEIRRMFGGWGVYQGDQFFGIIFKGRLYFKTNEATRARYKKFGMKPFKPSAKQTLKNYYEVPADILENQKKLEMWARDSAGFF